MPTLSYLQIAARFPEFASDDVILQSVIESVILSAALEIDEQTWGGLATEGLYWLTASKLAIAKINKFIFDAQISGGAYTNAKSIDTDEEVKVEFYEPASLISKLMSADSNRKNTYLIEYERLLVLVSDGMFYSFE